jgi:hypothetical protein
MAGYLIVNTSPGFNEGANLNDMMLVGEMKKGSYEVRL